MSDNPDEPKPQAPDGPEMAIDPDQPNRVRSVILFILGVLAVGGLFVWLLMRFTHSPLVAFGLTFGMLTYMLVMARWTSRNLRGPGE